MKLRELLEVFEQYAPASLQETYDNSGLQIGSPDQEMNRGLLCLDVTPAIVE